MKGLTEQFTDWVRTKPADEAYDYENISGCAMYCFLKAAGYPVEVCGGYGDWWDIHGTRHLVALPPSALSAEPRTFGALADRLAKGAA